MHTCVHFIVVYLNYKTIEMNTEIGSLFNVGYLVLIEG